MNFLDALILGIVQGLTEFLPVSSSGHLVLAEHWLGIAGGDLSFEVAVHVGTLVAVLVYFRSHLVLMARSLLSRQSVPGDQRDGLRMVLALIIGTIPAVIVGFGLKSQIEGAFASPRAAAFFLMVTGLWLMLMKLRPYRDGSVTPVKAWWIGVAQAVAILPGISRSGSTIATGAMLGVDPAKAAEFSFLLSIPAILGASILEFPDAMAQGGIGLAHLFGAVVAGIVGYVALRWVLASLRRGRFIWFGVYCLVVGALTSVSLL